MTCWLNFKATRTLGFRAVGFSPAVEFSLRDIASWNGAWELASAKHAAGERWDRCDTPRTHHPLQGRDGRGVFDRRRPLADRSEPRRPGGWKNRAPRATSPQACGLYLTLLLGFVAGCQQPGAALKIQRELDDLRARHFELERVAESRQSRITELEERIGHLAAPSADPALASLFEPASIEILPRSHGEDADGRVGDERFIAYIRPRDADGNIVPQGGRLTVRVLDVAPEGAPRVLAQTVLNTAETLRAAWHSRFMTDHFTVECAFSAEEPLPASGRVDVWAEWVSARTGATLRAVAQFKVTPPEPSSDPS